MQSLHPPLYLQDSKKLFCTSLEMQTTEGGEEKELEIQNSENLAQKRQAEESGAEPESKVRRSVKNIVCVTEKDVGIEKSALD